jgi:crotonobetainyl-CoA:carnitine CoA-transferase CaiB-like acyl-CoA transferase
VSARRPPLAGIRVADFSWVWAGPHCTLQLAHLGAEVIRVESATRPCVTRMLPPFADFKPGRNRSGYFNQYNQGKRSLSLDLKQPAALDVARRLCAASDVVVENFAAGVMERMGLGYPYLRTLKPDLVMISLSGYGAYGPDHDKVSYGPAQVPLSGLSSLTGYRGHPPMHVGVSYGDPTAGLHGAVAVLSALLHRARTGQGQYIDLSQWETSIAVLGEAILAQALHGTPPERDGNRVPHMAPHGVFRTAGDDRWLAITVENDREWTVLAALMARPELADDPRFATFAARKANEDALDDLLAVWTATRDLDALTATLQAAGIAAFAASTNRDLATDPHLEATGAFTAFAHPEVGTRRHFGAPWRLSASPPGVTAAAPRLGADTDAVLRDVCGYGDPEIAALRAAGALS